MNRALSFPITLALMVFALADCQLAAGAEVESFTEPYREVAIPAAEVGVLSEILVSEGDVVSRGQLLAQLDDRVLVASLEVARAAKDALGARRGAESELAIRDQQLRSFQVLAERGNATEREVVRAEGEVQQAAARLQAIREDLEVRRLEFERVKAQLASRRILSPIDGHVIRIDKEVGEFVAPTDPIVMHIVQLNTLKSVFSVPAWSAEKLESGQTVELAIGRERKIRRGVIEFVSPVADAQSATVTVKIRIPNGQGDLRSGDLVLWDLQASIAPPRVSRAAGQSR